MKEQCVFCLFIKPLVFPFTLITSALSPTGNVYVKNNEDLLIEHTEQLT